MFSIQTNVASLYGQQNLSANSSFQQTTITRLTSGYRINSSSDDAAGLAIANSLRSVRNELTQGVRNGNDGVSQLQIIDGGLNNVSQILDRLKTLATQAASSTFTGNFATLNKEFEQQITELNRQAGNIGLNTGGNFNAKLNVYIGGGMGNQNNNVIGTQTERVDLANDTSITNTITYAYAATASVASTASTASIAATSTSGSSTASTASTAGAVMSTSTVSVSGLSNAVDATGLNIAYGTLTGSSSAAQLNLLTNENALLAIGRIQQAVTQLGKVQGVVGAGINQLNFGISLAQSQITNYAASESRIRDADIAAEASNLTKASTLQQSSMAALSQANQIPQSILRLLQ